MAALRNVKYEHFASAVARGASYTKAYVSAGYSAHGAAQSARRLLNRAEVSARVAEIQQEIAQSLVQATIRDLNSRVAALEDRWQRMRRVIAERAEDPHARLVPGGTTGLLVRTMKFMGRGAKAREVEEWAVDTGLLAELREHEAQAAKELGQWKDHLELSGGVNFAERLAAGRRRVAEARAAREGK